MAGSFDPRVSPDQNDESETKVSSRWLDDPNVEAAYASFAFDRPRPPISLYDCAPVLRIRDERGDWVLKRRGQAHSSGDAIGRWTSALRDLGVGIVAPSMQFRPNPRRLGDSTEWIVYPFVEGISYHAGEQQIADAGRLLGRMHVAGLAEHDGLALHPEPVFRDRDWIERHLG